MVDQKEGNGPVHIPDAALYILQLIDEVRSGTNSDSKITSWAPFSVGKPWDYYVWGMP